MSDPRYDQLAKCLVEYSIHLKAGERVLIDAFDVSDEAVIALIRAVHSKGGIPFVQLHRSKIARELALTVSQSQLDVCRAVALVRIKKMQAYIALRGGYNTTELIDVPKDNMALIAGMMRHVVDCRVNKTKWVVLRCPTSSFAQQAQMSTEAFEDFYFRVCTLDYSSMLPAMEALRSLMEKTDKVSLVGPETDLRFSIKGIGAVTCSGERNIPDGEVFSCPRKRSVEGHVHFNVPTIYQGVPFDNIHLEFKAGKIVRATSSNAQKLNEILDSDTGARYIGEFSLGLNPYILHPIRDILFDEKIAGSFHFTPGQAYSTGGNGNKSRIHWDMVSIQRADYGGGEVWFDGELIRKDGLFVLPALQKLNAGQSLD
ncbi:MAG: aminopeptidase [Candidatus Xiphinematobacter sp.]|nr:MAG: aminopeptidase [Candidatus Xiphinematobacter sp.]